MEYVQPFYTEGWNVYNFFIYRKNFCNPFTLKDEMFTTIIYLKEKLLRPFYTERLKPFSTQKLTPTNILQLNDNNMIKDEMPTIILQLKR